mgnify:CR=1 FL=1
MKVFKFGGASVKDASGVKNLIRVLETTGYKDTLIVVSAIWSASGLEITLDRILNAPAQIATLVGAMFPLDLSSEAFDRIIPKVFESLFIAWAGTVIGAIFSFPISFLAANNITIGSVNRVLNRFLTV